MKLSLQKMLVLTLCVSGLSLPVYADTSGAAQLETTPPAADGPMPTEQTPSMIAKSYNNNVNTNNNNPQGNYTPPKANVMTPTNGNAASTPVAPSGQPLPSNAPIPASPTNPNANLPH